MQLLSNGNEIISIDGNNNTLTVKTFDLNI